MEVHSKVQPFIEQCTGLPPAPTSLKQLLYSLHKAWTSKEVSAAISLNGNWEAGPGSEMHWLAQRAYGPYWTEDKFDAVGSLIRGNLINLY